MDEKYSTLIDQYDPKSENENMTKECLDKNWEDVAVYSLMGKIIENGDWS
jgi:hypothetical protein